MNTDMAEETLAEDVVRAHDEEDGARDASSGRPARLVAVTSTGDRAVRAA
jgi:hypothetical protein